MRFTQTLRLAVTALLTAGLLASCGTTPSNTPEPSPETITINTDFGEVTVPKEPKAALGFYTTDVDMLITLGYPLAHTQPIRDDWDSFPSFFPQEELAGIKTFHNYPEYNLEKILEIGPDFILNSLGDEKDLHSKLTAIAPTYTHDLFAEGDWRDKFLALAKDLGREQQAKTWLDNYYARAASVKERLEKAGISPVVADVGYAEGEVSVNCASISCLVFADLGLTVSAAADGDGDGKPDPEGKLFSMEQLGQLSDIDVIFTGVFEDGSGPLSEEALTTNELWKSLPAVANNQIFTYNYEMYFGSPSGQDSLLNVIEEALLEK